MKVQAQARLAERTTLRIGGPALFHIEAEAPEELREAYGFARERSLPAYPLGGGSNILAADGDIRKALISLGAKETAFQEREDGALAIADAGLGWDAFVEDVAQRGLWGIENLAGIPGTVGAAPVQNIGAYGREAADCIQWVEAYDPARDEFTRVPHDACAFGYRDSRFKRAPGLFITRVAFLLSRAPKPELSYPDLRALIEAGAALEAPAAIAGAVRAIRSRKFPDLAACGTAGSFFKNPVLPIERYDELARRYDGLPGYAADGGMKVPLAWILDRVLGMRGFALGPVALFERQPLVLVAHAGAAARDVDALASLVEASVHDATGVRIEREVQSLA